MQSRMGIAQHIGRLSTGVREDFLMVLRRTSVCDTTGLEASLDQCYLLSAIIYRPVASGLANDLELLEEGGLVPRQANLYNLAICGEQDEVSLGAILSA